MIIELNYCIEWRIIVRFYWYGSVLWEKYWFIWVLFWCVLMIMILIKIIMFLLEYSKWIGINYKYFKWGNKVWICKVNNYDICYELLVLIDFFVILSWFVYMVWK